MKLTIENLSAFGETVKTTKYESYITYLSTNSHSIQIRNASLKFKSNIVVKLNRLLAEHIYFNVENPDFQTQRIRTEIIADNDDDVLHIFVYN